MTAEAQVGQPGTPRGDAPREIAAAVLRVAVPILLAAIDGGATHLLTGDWEHFGPYFRQEIAGVLILPPAEYPPMTAEG